MPLPRPPHTLAQSIVLDAIKQGMADQERLIEARILLRRVLDTQTRPGRAACLQDIKVFLKGDRHVATP